jgi:hypothetical protein
MSRSYIAEVACALRPTRVPKLVLSVIAATLALIPLSSDALATTKYWLSSGFGSSGSWSTPSTWQPSGVPGAGDDVNAGFSFVAFHPSLDYDYTGSQVTLNSLTINGDGGPEGFRMSANDLSATTEFVGYQSGVTFDQSGGSNTLNQLQIGYLSSSSGVYMLRGGSLTATGREYVGNYGIGTFTQSGGTNTLSGDNLEVGFNAGSTGTYNLSDTGMLTVTGNDGEAVGYSGTGNFNQSGGTNTAAYVVVGSEVGSSGMFTLSSGSLATSGSGSVGQIVGSSGTGTFTQSGGSNTVSNDNLHVGFNAGSTGTYNLSDTGILTVTGTSGEVVGYSGTGNFNQNGGTNTAAYVVVGSEVGSNGTFTLSSGSLATSGPGSVSEIIGSSGTGTFNQTGGTNTVTGANGLSVGDGAGSMGTYKLSGTATLSVNRNEIVGKYGTGTFDQTGGTNTMTGGAYDLSVGDNTGSIGTYKLGGTALLSVKRNEIVGNSGTGSFEQTGGTNSATKLYLGFNAGSSGSYTLSAGSLSTSGEQWVGYQGTGTFIQEGGSNSLTSSICCGILRIGSKSGTNGSYTLHAGSLSAYDVYVGDDYMAHTGTGTFTQSGGSSVLRALYVGTFSPGTYSLSGGTITAQFEEIGSTGDGTFNQTGGSNFTNETYIGNAFRGEYNLSGGTASTSYMNVGDLYTPQTCPQCGPGILSVSGTGSLTIYLTLTVQYGIPGTSVTLDGGAISAQSIFDQADLTIQRGTLTVADVMLSATSRLMIGLGGTDRTVNYGALTASGTVTVDGSLIVSLTGGFMPANGASFDILDWSTLTGTFSSIQLPALTNGLVWNSSQLYMTGVVSVTLGGDYNHDGIIDAADYTVWRDHFALVVSPCTNGDGDCNGFVNNDDYQIWKMNFGQAVATGAASATRAAVPEPASTVLILLAAALLPFTFKQATRQ